MSATQRFIIGILASLSVLSMGVLVHAQAPQNASPIEPQAGTWKTWLLRSSDQFRLPAPPDATATRAEVTELQKLAANRDAAALDSIEFWRTGSLNHRWNELAVDESLKNGFNHNRGIRMLALLNTAIYDALVATWDTKYAYWAIRPSQLDPEVKTLFANPNHPSYPSAHGCVSGVNGAIMSYLFLTEAKTYTALAEEAAESRVWAGIHYRSDIVVGLELGRKVTGAVIEWAKSDGSH